MRRRRARSIAGPEFFAGVFHVFFSVSERTHAASAFFHPKNEESKRSEKKPDKNEENFCLFEIFSSFFFVFDSVYRD